MDASTIKVASRGTLHVKSAAGEPLYDGDKPVLIHLHSPGTRQFGAVEARRTARALKRLNDNDGKLTAPTAEEQRAELAEDLADVTIGFDHLGYGDKTGRELFEAVYGDAELGFIAKQVNKYLGDWANFPNGSATS